MTDQQLIEGIYQGNNNSFQLFVEKYQHLIYKVSYGILQNKADAEDIAQDVFIEIYKSIADFRKESKISTWIYRITLNKSLNLLKKNNRKHLLPGFEFISRAVEKVPGNIAEPITTNVEKKLEDLERQQIVKSIIQKLPKNQKIAFTLSKYKELSYKEISEIMDVSVSAVESLIHRAKQNIAKMILSRYKKNEL